MPGPVIPDPNYIRMHSGQVFSDPCKLCGGPIILNQLHVEEVTGDVYHKWCWEHLKTSKEGING